MSLDAVNPHADQTNVTADALALAEHEVVAFVEAAERLAKDEVTPETEKLVADLVVRERTIRKSIEDHKAIEKAPLLARQREIDGRVSGQLDRLATALSAPKEKLRAYMLAKEQKRQAAEAAARAAAEAAKANVVALVEEAEEATPFERFRAQETIEAAEVVAAEAERTAERVADTKTSVATYSGKAVGLRTVKVVKLSDEPDAAKLLLAHYAADPDVIEAALKVARRMAKADKYRTPIPGVVFKDDKVI